MNTIRVAIIALLCFHSYYLWSQDLIYKVYTDTSFYYIGSAVYVNQQLRLAKEAYPDATYSLDTLPESIGCLELSFREEIKERSKNDSLIVERTSLYTALDTGLFALSSFGIKVNDDSVYSNPETFEIALLPVDTAQGFKGIMNPVEVGLSLEETWPWLLLGLVALVLGVVLFIFFFKRKNSQTQKDKKSFIPAYIEAFEKLEDLKAKKLWQQGDYKAYHLALSEIFRTYVQRHFEINVLDKPSHEVLLLLEPMDLPLDIKAELQEFTTLNDLAKFAKSKPLPDENEKAWKLIHQFVAETMNKSESDEVD